MWRKLIFFVNKQAAHSLQGFKYLILSGWGLSNLKSGFCLSDGAEPENLSGLGSTERFNKGSLEFSGARTRSSDMLNNTILCYFFIKTQVLIYQTLSPPRPYWIDINLQCIVFHVFPMFHVLHVFFVFHVSYAFLVFHVFHVFHMFHDFYVLHVNYVFHVLCVFHVFHKFHVFHVFHVFYVFHVLHVFHVFHVFHMLCVFLMFYMFHVF